MELEPTMYRTLVRIKGIMWGKARCLIPGWSPYETVGINVWSLPTWIVDKLPEGYDKKEATFPNLDLRFFAKVNLDARSSRYILIEAWEDSPQEAQEEFNRLVSIAPNGGNEKKVDLVKKTKAKTAKIIDNCECKFCKKNSDLEPVEETYKGLSFDEWTAQQNMKKGLDICCEEFINTGKHSHAEPLPPAACCEELVATGWCHHMISTTASSNPDEVIKEVKTLDEVMKDALISADLWDFEKAVVANLESGGVPPPGVLNALSEEKDVNINKSLTIEMLDNVVKKIEKESGEASNYVSKNFFEGNK